MLTFDPGAYTAFSGRAFFFFFFFFFFFLGGGGGLLMHFKLERTSCQQSFSTERRNILLCT